MLELLSHDRPGIHASRVREQLLGTVWWALAASFVFVVLVLVARRLAGALATPLGGVQFALVTVSLSVLVAAMQRMATGVLAARIALAVAALVGMAAVTLPGTPPWSVGCCWFALVAVESAVFLAPGRPRLGPLWSTTRVAPTVLPGEESTPAGLIQQVTRKRTDSGGESIQVLARADCPVGDRLAVVHLAFCPPLATAPRLSARVIDAHDAQAQITLAETYGARIEVRLPKAAEAAQSVLLQVLGESDEIRPLR